MTQTVQIGSALHEWQANVMHQFALGKRGGVLVLPRQVGKSLTGSSLISVAAMDVGARYVCAFPQAKMAKAVLLPYFRSFLAPVPHDVSLGDLTITLQARDGNESIIHLIAATDEDGGSARGLSNVRGLFVDEVANVGADALWGMLYPMQNAAEDPFCLLTGTPRGIDALSDAYQMASDNPDWFAMTIHPLESPMYTQEKLDQLERTLPHSMFRREIMVDLDVSPEDILIPLEDVIAAQNRGIAA